jgi:hypothetical protein
MMDDAFKAILADQYTELLRVKETIDALPGRMAPIQGAIVRAHQEAMAAIEQYGAAQENRLINRMELERLEFRQWIKGPIKDEIQNGFEANNRSQQQAANALQAAQSEVKRTTLRTLLIALGAGVLGALLAATIAWFALGEPLWEQFALGRATTHAWATLDAESQAKIQAER